MSYYCEKCREMHTDNDLCPHIKYVLKKNPQYLIDIANFTEIVGQNILISSLDKKLDQEIIHALGQGDNTLITKLQQTKQELGILKKNTPEKLSRSAERLINKIINGQAVTGQQIMHSTVKGGVIGVAFGITVSGITSYVRCKNGEITQKEAYTEIVEGIVKGMIRGATMGALAPIFVPAGPIGWVAGIGIGVYIDKLAENILDEIFGKGEYAAILNSSGYIYVTSRNIEDILRQYANNIRKINEILELDKMIRESTNKNLDEAELLQKDTERMLNGDYNGIL